MATKRKTTKQTKSSKSKVSLKDKKLKQQKKILEEQGIETDASKKTAGSNKSSSFINDFILNPLKKCKNYIKNNLNKVHSKIGQKNGKEFRKYNSLILGILVFVILPVTMVIMTVITPASIWVSFYWIFGIICLFVLTQLFLSRYKKKK